MVNHGISTGALFLLVGMIYERRHTRRDRRPQGPPEGGAGLRRGVFTVVMLSSIGLPGLNGFVGEFLILLGSFLTRRWWAVVAATGVILAALYLLWAYQRVFHGEPDERERHHARPDGGSWLDGALLGLIVFLGVYPKPVLDRIEPSVDRLVAHVEDRSGHRAGARTDRGPGPSAGDEGGGVILAASETDRRLHRATSVDWRRSRPMLILFGAASLILLLGAVWVRRWPRRARLLRRVHAVVHRRRASVSMWDRVDDDGRA